MKAASIILCLLVGAFLGFTSVDGAKSGDKTITRVVKLLQKMLDQSKKDADSDKELYAKFKCYVDKNEAEKKESIKSLAEQIDLLESKIAELQARNGELAGQTASLDADMTANKAAQKSATQIRKDSKKAFDSMEEDLNKGIGQMKEAIDVLSSIKLMQQDGSVHKKQAALLNMGTSVRDALTAASALLPPDKRQSLQSFIQAPLAAAHSAQGDAITGVLKSLKETFEGNLDNAQASEKAEKKAFEDAIDTLESSWDKMDKSTKEKKQEMGENDGELSDSKTSLDEAIKQKKSDEDFLESLLETAAKKAKNYEERKMLRVNEDAAIAECISILNSDDAFSTFGNVDATSTGKTSFLQMRQLRGGAERQQVVSVLEQAHSQRLARVAAGLRAGHAFTTVLEEIEKMKKTIAEEGQADKENLDWCKKERTNSNKDLDAKKSQIKTLNEAIDKLDETINDPKTGLLVQISDTETSLVENQKTQVDETKTRKEENAEYRVDVAHLAEATDILGKAIKVLARYYDQLDTHMKENKDSTNLVQEDPKPPELYGNFEGQSDQGNKALDMLKFIKDETEKEHAKADSDEKQSQGDFEDSISALKKAETKMQKALVKLKADLTEAELKLEEKRTDLKETTAAKEAIEAYLLDIKPGCDFITDNFTLRDENRNTETKALNKAKGLIKDTPAYKSAVAKDAELAAGKCKSECKLDTTNVGCKACMSGTSKANYCKDHPGMPGCK